MSKTLNVEVPDIGDFGAVPVIEVLVKAGDHVRQEQSLVTLESDKATMEVPAPAAGKVLEVKVAVGATVSQGDVILSLEVAETEPGVANAQAQTSQQYAATPAYAAAPALPIQQPEPRAASTPAAGQQKYAWD
ncbi:MAG TPA: biotin/lipoyl-containing protein, partial [Xanthomonadales bacterium]|nr:biotin/lipoyl-containing protein [Xanthomonadales bacterium]